MANIIAIIWDFDKTLVNGYMQDPIFKAYGVESGEIWDAVNAMPNKYMLEQNVKVNPDTAYLNYFINNARSGGKFAGLNNAKLREFGKKLKFYKGIPEIFEDSKKLIESNNRYKEYDIHVEHYIVSTGFAEMIKGSLVNKYVENIWGCELIEHEENGQRILGEIGYTIDNTSKTRALFEINKGVHIKDLGLTVNSKVAAAARRVHFENMIYIADGPSDIPAFSVVNKNGGSTFAIYPKGDTKAFNQVEQMRIDGRVNMYAEADYQEGTTAYIWITETIKRYAERICSTEKAKLIAMISDGPKHLTD